MTWVIGGGTLPVSPDRIIEGNVATVDVFNVDGESPVLTVPGLDARSLTIEGLIFDFSKTNAEIESTYLAPLRALVGQEAAVTSPDSQYNGTWVILSFAPRRQSEGASLRYYYNMRLLQGSSHIIL